STARCRILPGLSGSPPVRRKNTEANAEAERLRAAALFARGLALLSHHEVCAAVLGPGGFSVPGIERAFLAIAHCLDARGRDSLTYQEFLGGVCTPVPESQVVLF